MVAGQFLRHESGATFQRIIGRRTGNVTFSILKRGIFGVYHHVSEAHLHRYLSEFDFRYSNREGRGIDDVNRAARTLQGAKGKRLTYQTTHSPEAEA